MLLDLINSSAAKEAYREALVPVDPAVLRMWIERRHSLAAFDQDSVTSAIMAVGHTALDVLGTFKMDSERGPVREVVGVELRSQIVQADYRGKRVYAGLTAAGLWTVWQMYESSGVAHVVFVHKGPGSRGVGLITNGLGFRNITSKLFQTDYSSSPPVLTARPTRYMDYLPEGMRAGALRRGPAWSIHARKISRVSKDGLQSLLRNEGWEFVR